MQSNQSYIVLFSRTYNMTDLPAWFDQIHRMPAGCIWQFNARMRVVKVKMWAAQPYSFRLQYRLRTWWGGFVWRTVTETMGIDCADLTQLLLVLGRQRRFQRSMLLHYWRRNFVARLVRDHADQARRTDMAIP